MENNAFTEKIKAQKKNRVAGTIIVFFAVWLFLSFSFNIFASNAIRVENCNKCEEYSQKLGKEINDFIELDTEPTKAVSSQVTAAINEYRKKVIDLQSHADVETRSLENEILLAYTQGNAAGRLAWVYYYNVYTFGSDTSADKISAKYTACKTAVANAAQHTVLAAESEVLLDELNRLIFTERAQNLSLPTDSLISASLISGAVESFKTISSPDLFGENYRSTYDTLVTDLGLQRVRDALTAEIEEAFAIIRPNESFSSSSTVSLFIFNLKNATSVKSMNDAAFDCTSELLSPNASKPYSYKEKTYRLSAVRTATSRATENSTAADLTDIFDGYPLSLKKAEIKDSIYALFLGDGTVTDEGLIKLEKQFNDDGGAIDSCSTDEEAEKELINAKASLFLYEHDAIIKKSLDSLSTEDEPLAKKALTAYSSLEKKVKETLLTQINIIAEKYNTILIKKITALAPNDALYLDFCEKIANEIKSTSRENIDDFYNNVSRIPEKAIALEAVIREYRLILASENYKGYTKAESDALLTILNELSSGLSAIDPSDVAIYSDEINDEKASAIRKLNVTDQCARVRIATRGSANPDVTKELNTAIEKIKLCSEKNEMASQANRAIYKIQRLLTSDAINAQCNALKSTINKMQFLTSEEKSKFAVSITSLSERSKAAKEAENIGALELIWNEYSEAIKKIENEANAIDLSRAITAYTQKITEDAKKALDNLAKLEYIAKDKSEEIYNQIKALEATSKEKVPQCKSTAEVVSLHSETLKKLEEFLKLAEGADLDGYKLVLLSEFDRYEQIKSNYSDENYNKILNIKQATKEKLSPLSTKTECEKILAEAHKEVEAINDLLDDEKDTALDSLLTLLNSLKEDSPLYSSTSFASIEGLYDEAKLEIGKITDIASISLVKQTLAKYISLIKGVNKDSLYTSKDAYSISTPSLQYPSDYDFSKGLLGSIHSSNGLVSDARFSVNILEGNNLGKVESLIRRSTKNGSLVIYQDLPEQTLKLLRSASVAMALDLSLSSITDGTHAYTVQILIPQDLSDENILGLAFVDGDTVEFYPIKQADSLISANLKHFSKYYVVVESTLNVKPLLIALVLLLIAEFLVLIAILYLRYKRKNEKESLSDLPELPLSAIIPTAPVLARVYPENGVLLAILLSIAAIALASTIALLIKAEVKEKSNNPQAPAQKRLKGKKEPMLLGEGKLEERQGDEFFDNSEEIFCNVGAPQETSNWSHKAEIDLDVIAQSFDAGEKVDLEALKRKGLVGEKTDYVKILTKGNLTKPLTIEANDFSNAAKEVLRLSGGEARKTD